MSDRRRQLIAGALLLLAPRLALAQEAAEWRARMQAQAALASAAHKAYSESNSVERVYDSALRRGNFTIAYAAGSLRDADTTAIGEGLRRADAQLRARFGADGAALAVGVWSVERRAGRRAFNNNLLLENSDGSLARQSLASPVDPREVERFVIAQAGAHLVRITPALRGYAGWAVFQHTRELDEELARRLATSWAASGRRCAAGALDACATVLTPFDPSTAIAAHFEPRDYRTVVASGRLPALSDSAFFVARRACLDGSDSSCVSIIHTVLAPDPHNEMVRGSLLAHAIELGGTAAVTRAAERADAEPLVALAHIAGVPADSLLASWHRRTFSALDEKRSRTELPLLLSSIAWGGLLLLAATRRKFL